MRVILAIALALGLVTPAHAELRPYNQKPTVSFKTLPAIAGPNQMNKSVHYLGGYEMTAHGTEQFLGLSDLQLFPINDGLRVEAISDLGAAVTFDMVPDGKGGMRDTAVDIDLLRDQEGHAYFNRELSDAEDIAYDANRGTRYVSFERLQRVMAYPAPDGWRGTGRVLPLSGLAAFPTNEGMEGLTLVKGSLLIGVEAGGFWTCPLTTYDCREVSGPGAPGFLYKLTSLAVLDDSVAKPEILTLYRYFDPFTGPRNILRLLRLDGDRLVVVEDLLKIAPPLPWDNYEGVAAVKTPTGYRLYLICDGLHDTDKPKILVYDWVR